MLVETSEREVSRAVETFTRGGLDARLVVSEERYANIVIGARP